MRISIIQCLITEEYPFLLTWTWTHVTRWCFRRCTNTHITAIGRSRIITCSWTRSCPTATRDVTCAPVVPTRPCSIHLLEESDSFKYTNISLFSRLKINVSINYACTYTCNVIWNDNERTHQALKTIAKSCMLFYEYSVYGVVCLSMCKLLALIMS